jgi:transcriptional regulator with XRE-family HTH domain
MSRGNGSTQQKMESLPWWTLKWIREAKATRIKNRITLTEAGQWSGVSDTYLGRLESEQLANPTVGTLERYFKAVGYTPTL